MRAMVLRRIGGGRLEEVDLPRPEPAPGQVLIEVAACGVCRTDLHVVDGDLTEPKLPIVPGHEIVGRVAATGRGVTGPAPGARVGVPWLGFSCGECRHCRRGRENLCAAARYTGYQIDGGFAEYTVADHRYVFPLPEGPSDSNLAPLLCAGLIGYRSYRMAGEAPGGMEQLGLYGFGAAAHIICQVAVHQGKRVHAFTRPGDDRAQAFARDLGAVWAGSSEERPPVELDAAILFAPVGALVPAALRAVAPGGTVVCAGIHMSEIPAFPYGILWEERVLRSVANLTRQDAEEFLRLAPQVPVKTSVVDYPLSAANRALDDLREGRFSGAAVLLPGADRD
jgi:propanol-preferring alcohol dehydrogenase